MSIDIYADVLFIFNLTVNYFSLRLCAWLIRRRASRLRLIFASSLTAILYCIAVPLLLKYRLNGIISSILAPISVYIAFKPSSLGEGIYILLRLLMVSIILSGVYMLLSALTSGCMTMPIMLITLIPGNFAVKLYERMKIMDIRLHKVRIELNGKSATVNAMLDTGNRLIEPIGKSSVILTEYKAISAILPDKLINIYEQKRESCLMELIEALGEESLRYNLRLVPYSSLGKRNGLLLGFCADRVAVDGIELSSVVIGICSGAISNGDCGALVAPEHIGGVKWISKII